MRAPTHSRTPGTWVVLFEDESPSFWKLGLLKSQQCQRHSPWLQLFGAFKEPRARCPDLSMSDLRRGRESGTITRQPRERRSTPRTPRNPRVGLFRDSNQAEKKKTK